MPLCKQHFRRKRSFCLKVAGIDLRKFKSLTETSVFLVKFYLISLMCHVFSKKNPRNLLIIRFNCVNHVGKDTRSLSFRWEWYLQYKLIFICKETQNMKTFTMDGYET